MAILLRVCMCTLLAFSGFLLLADAQALLKLNIFTVYLDASDVKVMSKKACRHLYQKIYHVSFLFHDLHHFNRHSSYPSPML